MTPRRLETAPSPLLCGVLLAIGVVLGGIVGISQSPPAPRLIVCTSTVVEVAECRVLVCEYEREVLVFKDTLRCSRAERVVMGYDADGFETARCEKKE